MLITRLCRTGAWGGGGGDGGAEPLAEGGGRVLAGPCGAAGPVMALLHFLYEWDRAIETVAGFRADPGPPRLRQLFPASASPYIRNRKPAKYF